MLAVKLHCLCLSLCTLDILSNCIWKISDFCWSSFFFFNWLFCCLLLCILAAVCPRWGQVYFWAQCEQTSLWGFDYRPAADHCYHPGIPVATYLRVWTRRKHADFLPRCQGQTCHRVLQHPHTRPNQVFSFPCSVFHCTLLLLLLLLHGTSFSHHDLFTSSSTSLLRSSSLSWELVNLWFPQQCALCTEQADKVSNLLEMVQLVSC